MNNIADVSLWLAGRARSGQPVGVDISINDTTDEYVVVFAGRTPGDEAAVSGRAGDEGAQMLQRFLESKDGIKLVAFSTPETTALLHLITKVPPHSILDHIVGDAFAVEYTIGRGHDQMESMVDEARYALSFWTGAQQITLPKFYQSVMQPLQRIMAVPMDNEGRGWMARFSELPLRVVAKYTHEPLLVRPFVEDTYPAHARIKDALAEIYPEITHKQTYAAIWYAALGGDYDYMKQEYPLIAAEFDEWDLEALGHNLDRVIPSIRMAAVNLWNLGGPARQFETLYGRRLPYEPNPGQGPGVFLDHVLAGTVIDLIHVFCVSVHNLGITVGIPVLNGTENTIEVHGILKGDPFERANQLKAIAGLGGPLNPIPLQPLVLLEGEDGKGFKA